VIALVLPMALQAATAAAAEPKPSLDQYGWGLVFAEGGEFPAIQYVEPASIRPLAGADGQFMVTTSAEWEGEDGNWRVSPTGLIVDCRKQTWRGDWISFAEAGQHVIAYIKDGQTYDYAAKSPMGSVIDRVCSSEKKAQ
jgi:hypothetical protein